MEVILKQDVQNLGKTGSVVKVKVGYARNFLYPQKLAVPATSANLKIIEQEKKMADNLKQRKKEQALNLSERLKNISITISAQISNEDRLYGSVNVPDIIDALKQEGISLDKDAILLEEPIKTTGVFEIMVRLHPEVSAKIKLWVVKK